MLLGVLLAALAAISLYPRPVPQEPTGRVDRQAAPPVAAVPGVTTMTAVTAPTPAPVTMAPPPPTPPASTVAATSTTEGGRTGPVQIERDAAGTITMIIQREQLQTSSKAKLPATSGNLDHSAPPALEAGATDEESGVTPPDDAEWAEPAALPEPCDCTHIVVKGDTLWAIARHYTNSAFNYPELARQSGISNPHRIYPGNKVRIIVR
jgi:nucleoid-associated protein YgaU